jgi:hypothetical protein
MIDDKKNEDFEATARVIAKEISEYRKEWVASLANGVLDEMKELEDEGIDPFRGRGRGPLWVDGE